MCKEKLTEVDGFRVETMKRDDGCPCQPIQLILMNKKCFIQTLKMFTYDTQEKKVIKRNYRKMEWGGIV